MLKRNIGKNREIFPLTQPLTIFQSICNNSMNKKLLIASVLFLLFATVFAGVVFAVIGKEKKKQQAEQMRIQQQKQQQTQEQENEIQQGESQQKTIDEMILASGADNISTHQDNSPEDVVIEFYDWYQKELKRCVGENYTNASCNYDLEKGETERGFVSKDFYKNTYIKALEKAPVVDGKKWLGYDPILCAQDFGFNLKAKLESNNSENARVEVVYLSRINYKDFEYQLTVELIKEDGRWKLNEVFCRE